jgi:hypothetical protein
VQDRVSNKRKRDNSQQAREYRANASQHWPQTASSAQASYRLLHVLAAFH